jgi:hypothetical protein
MRIVCAVALVAAALAALAVGCNKKHPVFPTCGDNVSNGDETDVDCGGQLCTSCNAGKRCLVDKDCRSLVCTAGACAAASCSDGILNGSESDIDCGGPDCPHCTDGHYCAGGNDCWSRVCNGGTCQMPSSSDGIDNDGVDGSADCGGDCSCDAGVTLPADLTPPTD